MTDEEWLACVDPTRMLQAISVNTSDRRWRLFGCACSRRIWELFAVDEWRTAIEVAERVAEGRASEEERETAYHAARELNLAYTPAESIEEPPLGVEIAHSQREEPDGDAIPEASFATGSAAVCSYFLRYGPTRRYIARYIAHHAAAAAAYFSSEAAETVYGDERIAQAHLIREIFGKATGLPAFESAWRTDTAVSLARQMYEARDFGAMPILADALQDAGCDCEDILSHCRDAGQVHVRGCWVVDLVLGKE
jgi:hypothetical protein